MFKDVFLFNSCFYNKLKKISQCEPNCRCNSVSICLIIFVLALFSFFTSQIYDPVFGGINISFTGTEACACDSIFFLSE